MQYQSMTCLMYKVYMFILLRRAFKQKLVPEITAFFRNLNLIMNINICTAVELLYARKFRKFLVFVLYIYTRQGHINLLSGETLARDDHKKSFFRFFILSLCHFCGEYEFQRNICQ